MLTGPEHKQCNALKKLPVYRQTVTHLNGLVPEGGVGEIVLVDFISCCVYINGSHYLDRYATLWRKREISL